MTEIAEEQKELCKCSDCRCTMIKEEYFSKNRKGLYLKTCNGCRTKRKKYSATPEKKVKLKEYRKTYDVNNKEKIKARGDAWYQDNKERHLQKGREWRDANPEKVKEISDAWYQNNKERHLQKGKEWREANPERMKELQKDWYDKNRDDINAKLREKRKTDPLFRISLNLRNRLCKLITKGYKSTHTMELLGCSAEELKEHLEKQFTEGMNFDNYGKWHVDHILPCASFNLLEPEEQRKCFHYTNLQPLWAVDNLSKGAKLDWIK